MTRLFDRWVCPQVETQRDAKSGMKAQVRELEAQLYAAHTAMADMEDDLVRASDEVRPL